MTKSPLTRGREAAERELDSTILRSVFGAFATGVVAVTAIDPQTNSPVGFAVNSFSSVSLRPALVSFCVGKSSTSWPRVQGASCFCVNVLAESQEWLSRKLAVKGGEKFDGVGWRRSPGGAPILEDAVAWIEATTEAVYPAGDHDVIIARVSSLESTPREPLVFFRGTYRRINVDAEPFADACASG